MAESVERSYGLVIAGVHVTPRSWKKLSDRSR
jgi:hypothetical protein